MFSKYARLFTISWQAGLAYPISFALWRVRQIVATFMVLTLWTVMYSDQTSLFGYQRNEILGYIFLVSLIQGTVMATSLNGLAHEIYSGNISQLLMKPVSILKYLAVQDVADKMKNLTFILLESVALFVIFQPRFVMPSLPHLLLFIVWVVLAIIIHYWIEILFGTLGFWSPQTWGPKFIFFMLIEATGGKLFPLDVLPDHLQRLVYLTPFPYFSFVQTQLFLGRLDQTQILNHSIGIGFWSIFLGLIAVRIWRKGIYDYSAAGN